MVTSPVHKAIINQSGPQFSGHTEYLGHLCETPDTVMMLANQRLRVILVTTHLPLKKVSEAISVERLEKVLRITDADLKKRFNLSQLRLLVCGLNPHAGEEGEFGDEEINIIKPTLEKLRAEGMHITGPVPADTAFTNESLQDIDAVVAMYHDQGLPVLKAQGFGETVNITLGLPIIRTSVDHGTALTLAGTGKASPDSLRHAIEQAIELANNKLSAAAD
jgi:4-hydroxythreonine-4-phosphate dehydrogenase